MNKRILFLKEKRNYNCKSNIKFEDNNSEIIKNQKLYKSRNCKQSGITLIALVISIIVMLILAGVSLNATIGDNGIITQAQNATYMQSVAVLEEFLNNYYVEHYEEFSESANKAEALQKYSGSSEWIWNPSKNGYGAIGYVINKDGNACYFIQKEKLPDEIKNQIKGGNAGSGTYADYASMKDVYGITKDLKVYYSNNDNIYGISKEELDLDDPNREVLPAGNSLSKLITGDANKNLTADNAKKISELVIDENSGVTDLSDLYVLTSLKKLDLSNVELENLDGMQNAVQLNEITIKNSTIKNYKDLGKAKNLEKLYLEYSDTYTNAQNEVNKFLSIEQGIGNLDFEKLAYLGIFGVNSIEKNNEYINLSVRSLINDLSGLSNLSVKTKNNIQYIYINNNNIENLEFLTDFSNLKKIRCEVNKIASLKGLNSNNLTTIIAGYNNLGNNENVDEKNEEIDSLKSLEKSNVVSLNLVHNNIKWVSYLEECKKINEIYLKYNSQLNNEDLVLIKNIYNSCSASSKSIDSNYLSLFSTDKRIDYSGKDFEDTSIEIAKLKNNTDVVQLCLDGNSRLTNKKLNEILSTCPNIKVLSLRNLKNLTSIEFISNMKNINELDLRETSVTDLSILDNLNSLGVLYISNKDIDLTKIQNLINNLDGKNVSSSGTFTSFASSGLIIATPELMEKLSNCTKIKKLKMTYQSSWLEKSANVDLSNCIELTSFDVKNVYAYFKLPSSVEEAWFTQSSANYPADLSLATNLKTLQVGHCIELTEEKSKEWFNQISKCSNLEKLELYETKFENLNGIEKVSKCTKLKELNLEDYNYNYNLENISGVENLTSLTTLRVGGRNLKDISNLSSLGNLEYLTLDKNKITDINSLSTLTNLKELNLSNNCITALKPLESLVNLVNLNLSNNLLYDTAIYVNDNENKTYKNLEIIGNLNFKKNGKLEKIYIAGNTGLIDYTILKNLKWNDKNGF